MLISHNKPHFGPETAKAAQAVMESGFLGCGEKTKQLEKKWCEITGAESACCVSSGTSALRLALKAVKATCAEVVIPGYACNSLANSVKVNDSVPVLADIKPDLTLDINSVLDHVTERTKAIIATHTFGAQSDIPSGLLNKRFKDIPTIEDMTHGIFKQKATLAVSSFSPTKLIGSASGGIVSGSKELTERVRDYRDYSDKPISTKQNDLPNDLAASIALEQLERLDEIYERRLELAVCYDALLCELEEKIGYLWDLPEAEPITEYYRYVIRLKHHLAHDISLAMQEKGVEALQPVFDPRLYQEWPRDLPVSDDSFRHILSLPFFEGITQEEQETVVSILGECLK